MKKAYFSIDMIASLVIFVTIISISFYYITYISKPKDPFVSVLKSSADELASSIEENVSWNIYRMPLIINSKNSSNISIEKKFYPDSTTDSNSIILVNENLIEINSDFFNNTIIFNSEVFASQNIYYLIYTKDTSLSKRSYSSNLKSSGIWVNNSLMNVSFSTSGITDINFNGVSILSNGTNLESSGIPIIELGATRAKKTYDNGIEVKIYDNNTRIVVVSNHSINPIIYVTKLFTNQYNGSVNSISTSGFQFNSIVNLLDIYDSNGIAVIGKNLNISLYNNTYNEIRIYDTKEFEIYLHEGTYTNALLERDIVIDTPNATFLIPEKNTGISYDLLSDLNMTEYSALKNYFSTGVNFNIT
ncbi:MAG: hypothetical protein KAS12_02700, partial [Candidatus Aenigmarchaeota archaeon]|nr:hypothetical protein [Candidatus Aenigmarchaeota archaeon]